MNYFKSIFKLIPKLPRIYVRTSEKKKRGYFQPLFYCENKEYEFPEKPGIYLVYLKKKRKPFYCGEADILERRVSFHFKDSPSAMNSSTLKTVLPQKKRSLKSMARILRIRVIEIPFARKDVETFLHTEFRINTKKQKYQR